MSVYVNSKARPENAVASARRSGTMPSWMLFSLEAQKKGWRLRGTATLTVPRSSTKARSSALSDTGTRSVGKYLSESLSAKPGSDSYIFPIAQLSCSSSWALSRDVTM
ncbi:MAG: hypothetical protein ACLSVD_08950 [Eggerthellaceae bacterium]